jgi:Chaperone of endosialidase
MKVKHFLLSIFFGLSVQVIQAERPLRSVSMAMDDCYISCSNNRGKLAEMIAEISSWDEHKIFDISQLNKYIADEHALTFEEAVLEVFAYAESVLEEYGNKISQDQVDRINNSFNALMDELESGDVVEDRDRDKDSIIKIKKKLFVLNKAKFFDKVTFKEDVKFKDHAEFEHFVSFHGNVKFRKNVEIDGVLSVADLVITNCIDSVCIDNLSVNDLFAGSADINCDLTVGCNISMNDSISADVGNIIKNGVSFIHTYPAASLNTFVGAGAGNFSMTGTQNAALGASALMNNTTGAGNTTMGALSLLSNTTGQHNTAAGNGALLSNTTGSFNTAIGYLSMFINTTGSLNVAVGDTSMTNNITGSQNVAVGVSTFASGDSNVIIGYNAGNNGSQNIGIGASSLFNINSNQNVALGFGSMSGSSSVNGNNTAIGYLALQNVQGDSNIAIGSNAGTASVSNTSNNNIYIGTVGADESGVIRIGTLGTHTTCFIQGIEGVTVAGSVPVLINAAGQLGTILSTRKVKHDIQKMADDSESIYQLNPVTFVYNNDPSETKQYGLIAEEVDQAFPALVVRDADGNPYTVQYQVLPVLLLNEVQKQHAALEQQKADFSHALEMINNRLAALEKHPRDVSNLAAVLAQISSWNENNDPLYRDLPNWFTCEIKEAILAILPYAEDIIEQKDGQLSPAQLAVINNLLNSMSCV